MGLGENEVMQIRLDSTHSSIPETHCLRTTAPNDKERCIWKGMYGAAVDYDSDDCPLNV
jgi:hypothetical protein